MKIKNYSRKTSVREIAEKCLIGARRCSKVKTEEYTVEVYGIQQNFLDKSRQWLYEENRQAGMEYEKAIVRAQKTLLYVNQQELDEMYRVVDCEISA